MEKVTEPEIDKHSERHTKRQTDRRHWMLIIIELINVGFCKTLSAMPRKAGNRLEANP